MTQKSTPKRVRLNNLSQTKEVLIPHSWNVKKIKEIGVIDPETIDEKQYNQTEIEYVDIGSITDYKIKETQTIPLKERPSRAQKILRKNDVIISTVRPYLKSFSIIENEVENLVGSTGFAVIRTTDSFDSKWIFYFSQTSHFLTYLTRLMQGGNYPAVSSSMVENAIIPYTDNSKEKEKITSILSNIDNLIQNRDKTIKQTQRLRQGMLQKIVTEGVDNKKLKNVNLGKKILNLKIPVDWETSKFNIALQIRSNSIKLKPEKKYKRIIVKRRHEGVRLRDEVHGKKILTENQYVITAGDYVLTHKQVIHGAGGIIPKDLDGAVISGEYSQFHGSDMLDIDYFNLFSMTNTFKKMIILTTQGVHIEKYVFLLKEWLTFQMPIPSMPEQKKIISIFNNIDTQIEAYKSKKNKLIHLKKSLLQKLLIGEVRVKV